MSKADTEALASLLEGSGLLEGLTGGKRSHKAQYVRWLLGNVVKRNPRARVQKDDKVHYNPPYNPPFDPYKMKEVAVSDRFGSVPRSEFINRMMATTEEREPLMTDIVLETGRKKLKKTVTRLPTKRVKRVRAQPAQPAERFPVGTPVPKSREDELIIYLHTTNPRMTERGIVAKMEEDYSLKSSQPTVHRRIADYKAGRRDAMGKKITQ